MKTDPEHISRQLTEKGLKVTPQRIAILEAVYIMNNHPSAEDILRLVRKKIPSIATGTVYHILETLVDHKIINRVKTDHDNMRYDGITAKHHHLYCSECDRIEDYFDDELDQLLKDYFRDKKLPDFTLEDVVLQIRGTFNKC